MPTVAAHAGTRPARRWPWVVAGAAVLALVPVGLFAWDGYQLLTSVDELESSAAAAQQAVTDRDATALTTEVADLQVAAATFAAHSSGWHWDLAAHVPWVSDQTVPLQQVGQSVSVIADDALGPLADMGDLSALEAPPIQDGRIDPFFLEDFRAPLAQASDVLAEQSEQLAAVDMTGTLEQISDPYEGLEDDLSQMGDLVYVAHVAAELLPTMLGGEEPRTYALMVQNNAEPRASGGIPGAVLELTVDDGRVSLGDYIPASTMSDPQNPVATLTDDEERIYSIKMAQYAQNVNFTPEYPRAAEVMAAFWERETGEAVDGVLSIDPVAMGYMLDGMEPVTIDDVEITSDNLAQVLLSDVYWKYPEPQQSDAFFALAARELFGQLLGGTTDVMGGVETAIDQRRFLAWSAHGSEQDLLATVPLAGDLVSDGDTTGVYLNDANGAKIGYYIDQDIEVTNTVCAGGEVRGQTLAVTFTHTYDGDIEELPDYVSGGGQFVDVGQFVANMHFYPPEGSTVTRVEQDGNAALYSPDTHDGRAMLTLRIDLSPGEGTTVEFQTSLAEPAPQAPQVAWTPLSRVANVTDVKTLGGSSTNTC
ncbi:DUF4012 domain-containing protein [Demequina sp. NBRC 110055]|uniref:DUF4012 domain-containing protein n=1 Tax=Demequina sp. NBRC 110055 TaxID=1570344 RepID=UPI001F28A904|nr:DUF4012 domain-containing protein [Demequina sp. NBRC 110055]